MRIHPTSTFFLALALATPLAAQRPPLATQVKPEAMNAVRLQVVRAGPGANLAGGPSPESPGLPSAARMTYLSPGAKRELLARSGVTGNVAEGVIRADPAPRGTRAFVHVIGAARVANRFPTRAGGTNYTPFAGFTNDPDRFAQIVVEVEPAGVPRYLVDCSMGSLNQFEVATFSGTRTQFNLPAAEDIEDVRHLRFVLELTSSTAVSGFAINARDRNIPWAFFGCELTPIS
jgi:hypothetical protein